MKIPALFFLLTVTTAFAASSGVSAPAPSDQLFVPVTLDINAAAAGEIYSFAARILNSAPVGTHVSFVSATALPRTITEIKIERYANRNVQQAALHPVFTALQTELREAALARHDQPVRLSIDVPQIVQFLQGRVGPGTRILFVGSFPWTREPALAFVDDTASDDDLRWRRPSHGHFSASSRLVSPFSTKGLEEALGGATVLWYNPAPATGPNGPIVNEIYSDFWRAFLTATGAKMASVDFDPQSALKKLFGPLPACPPGSINPGEAGLTMLSLRDLRNAAPRPAPLPPLTDIYVADCTMSMRPYLDAAARDMSYVPSSQGRRFALALFSDYEASGGRPAFLYSESNNPSDLAAAFRGAPLISGGQEDEEALGEGLKVCLDTLRSRQVRNAEIKIFTDAPGKEVSFCPPGASDFREIIRELQKDGHRITLVACGPLSTDWVPNGVTIKRL